MRSVRLLLTVCLLALISGCQTLSIMSGEGAITASDDRPNSLIAAQLPEATLSQGAIPQAAVVPNDLSVSQAAPKTVGPVTKPNEQQALQQVMPDLQALLAQDPSAHAALLQEFGKTDPSMWSALTRRARSKLAYQQGVEVSSPQQTQLQVAVAQQQAGEQAIVQQLSAQIDPTRQLMEQKNGSVAQQSNPLPSQMLANQMVNTSMVVPANSTQSTPAQPVALPKPNANVIQPGVTQANLEQTNVTQVNHTTTSTQTNQASNSNWIDNQHATDSSGQPNNGSTTVTVNPYVTTPNSPSIPNSQASEVRLASASPAPVAKAPTPQMIENPAYEPPMPTDWRKSLDTAIAVMKSNTPEQPASTEEAYRHARLRLLQLAAGKEEEAFDSIPGLSSTEQSYWSKQIYSMATLMDVDQQVDRKRRASSAAIHQSDALTQLRKMGTLQIRNLGFCSEIYGFGAYEPIPKPKFLPGAEASLYTEIENYHSDSTERGFHTLVATSYRVEDKSGSLVDEGEFPVVEDYCLSQRRDFHITYGVTLPTAIYPGEYHLKLTITDQLGDKIGEDSVPFEIIAQ